MNCFHKDKNCLWIWEIYLISLRSDIHQCQRAITALSPGFRRYAPTSLPACGGALQTKTKNGVRASSTPFFAFVCGERGILTFASVWHNSFIIRHTIFKKLLKNRAFCPDFVPASAERFSLSALYICQNFKQFWFVNTVYISTPPH